MLNLLQTRKGHDRPSELRDPFQKDSFDKMLIASRHRIGSGKIYFWGEIQFQNGNTSGAQRFEADTFLELVQQMENFANQL